MFRMLIHPSLGACDYLLRYCVGCIVLTWGVLVLCSGIGCWWCGIRVQAELVVQPALGYHIPNWRLRTSAMRMRHLCVQILLQTVCDPQFVDSSERCEAGSRLCGKWPCIFFILAISGFHFQLSSCGPCDTPTLWATVEIYFSQHPSFATAPSSRRSFWTGLSKTFRVLLVKRDTKPTRCNN